MTTKVSILVAVRNEEATILDCLNALDALDFPKEELQILIGDDDSEDQSYAIIENFIRQKPHFQLISIQQNQEKKKKTNVLAQLAHLAQGEFWLITDADICVPKNWIKKMTQQAQNPNVGIVTGFTKIQTSDFSSMYSFFLSHFQATDWLFVLGIIQQSADFGFETTTMGNNMLIRKTAYWQTGGYEKIPFSVTEDFALFQEVRKLGWDFRQVCDLDVLANSKPMPNWTKLLSQRKRWTTGAMKLPFFWLLIAFSYLGFLPLLVGIFFINPVFCGFLWLFRLFLISYFLIKYGRKTKQGFLLYFLPFYDLLSLVFNSIWLFYFLLPIRFDWKSRKY